MANHVNTTVHLHTTEEGKKRFEEILSRVSTLNDKDVYSHNAEELFDSDDMGSYDGNINNMGAKWVTVDEFGEDYLHLTSAWSVPDGVVEMISKEINEVDDDSYVTVEYEDEMPNFVGVALYKGGEVVDQEMFDWDEIKDKLNEVPELAEHWDEEEEDWSDEGRDIMSEYLWETTREMQDNALQYMLTSVE
jgi:hypothetical protein